MPRAPDGERVRQAVKVVTELLAADHLKPAPQPEVAQELAPFNELGQMAERCGASAARFRLDVISQPAPDAARPRRAARRSMLRRRSSRSITAPASFAIVACGPATT